MKRRTFVLGAAVATVLPGAGRAVASQPARTLRSGTAAQAGLLPRFADRIPLDAAAGLEPGTGVGGHPLYPGAVVLAARHGVIVQHAAAGHALRYADQDGTELPRDQWIPMRPDTIFDMASISKIFTSLAAMQQIERGRIDLDASVASYLPGFAVNGKGGITIRQLYTHTSGLPADPSPGLWTYPTYAERVGHIFDSPLQNPPGSTYLYSDINFMTLGKVAETVGGKSLDRLVREGITAPLGMTDTMYNPPASLKPRIAAEEYEYNVGRGLVWGQVHDENAWALNGVSGHAGVFSTAHDMAILCQAILNGGSYGRARILSRQSIALMSRNYNQQFPDDSHGLGFELQQNWYMGALSTPYTLGHTGYTGTSFVIDPVSDSFVILLTNHVHPNRNWGSVNPARAAVADDLGRAVPVRPRPGTRYSWFSGLGDPKSTVTLTVPVQTDRSAELQFGLWYNTEDHYDYGYLEISAGAGSSWKQLPFRLDADPTDGSIEGYGGNRWRAASAGLPAGDLRIRWRYTTDVASHGRGIYVSGIRVHERGRVVFDDRRPADAARIVPEGWSRSTD